MTDATTSIVHCSGSAGAPIAPGTWTKTTNAEIMIASSVAARRGAIPKKIATPAATCAAPVSHAQPERSGSHAGTALAVAETSAKW